MNVHLAEEPVDEDNLDFDFSLMESDEVETPIDEILDDPRHGQAVHINWGNYWYGNGRRH